MWRSKYLKSQYNPGCSEGSVYMLQFGFKVCLLD